MSTDEKTTKPVKNRYGKDGFPILSEKLGQVVYENPNGEIVIEDLQTGCTMRVKNHYPSPGGGIQFTVTGNLQPVVVDGVLVWRVGPR